jgi:phage-related protein
VKNLDNLTTEHKNQLESEDPFIWLFEFEVPTGERYRLTNYPEKVEFGEDESGDPLVYYPAPIAHSGIDQDGEGGLPTIKVSLATGGAYWLTSVIDENDGLINMRAKVIIVSSRALDDGNAAVIEEARIIGATMNHEVVTVELSAYNLFRARLPRFLYSRRRCRWIFGSLECGYNINLGSFNNCTYTLEACEERGDDEVANGLERQHPARFGGFPGIPRGSRR